MKTKRSVWQTTQQNKFKSKPIYSLPLVKEENLTSAIIAECKANALTAELTIFLEARNFGAVIVQKALERVQNVCMAIFTSVSQSGSNLY